MQEAKDSNAPGATERDEEATSTETLSDIRKAESATGGQAASVGGTTAGVESPGDVEPNASPASVEGTDSGVRSPDGAFDSESEERGDGGVGPM